MTIPQDYILPINRLSHVFDKTVASYKFFWFLSILQIHAKENILRMSIWDIVIRMVANSWYSVHYFKLSFGKSDSLFKIVMELHHLTRIPIDTGVEEVIEGLSNSFSVPGVRRQLKILTNNVPYRFLRPWIDTSDDRAVVECSHKLDKDCLYALRKEENEMFVELNPRWDNYLHQHYSILIDFAYWNLVLFLQKFNPNVPNIPNKLIKPLERTSLKKQHDFWNAIIDIDGPRHCIYTGQTLYKDDYDLDHFIPWSFVSHDLLWNLIPSDGSINSSKSNRLPVLDIYLPKLANMQQKALQVAVHSGRRFNILDDYLSLGYTPKNLVEMSSSDFLALYERTFNPINQIALNMGFEVWKY
jgi:hypothetical protein